MTTEELINRLIGAIPKVAASAEPQLFVGGGSPAVVGTLGVVPDSGQKDTPGRGGRDPLSDEIAILTREIAELRRTSSSQSQLGAGEARGSGVASIAASVLTPAGESLLGAVGGQAGPGGLLSPVIAAAAKLLWGGDRAEEEPLRMYASPMPFAVEAGIGSSGRIEAVSYGVRETPRTVAEADALPLRPITIQVQTMDSRSFADHSDEIARAVREAILSGHGLNEAFGEL